MPDPHVVERIEAWAAAGLIDEATAERLRAAETAIETGPADASPTVVGDRGSVASFFGPPISIGEVFAYVGAGFLLAAWHTLYQGLFNRFTTENAFGPNTPQAVQFAIPAIALAVVGILALRRGDRGRRGAGVAFVVASGHVLGAAEFATQSFTTDFKIPLVVASGAAVIAAILFRRIRPAVLTQLALLGGLVILAASSFGWLGDRLFPVASSNDFGPQPLDQGAALARVFLTFLWWIVWAVGFGLLALMEARSSSRADVSLEERSKADRRANSTRFIAGLTAVVGTFVAVQQGNPYDRVLAPWIGDLVILAVAIVLIGVAFRRNATAYLLPAAVGVIGALSELNATYVADQTGIGVALLIEGLILIGVGLSADRLRRRLWGDRAANGPTPTAPPADPPPAPILAARGTE